MDDPERLEAILHALDKSTDKDAPQVKRIVMHQLDNVRHPAAPVQGNGMAAEGSGEAK